MLSEAGGGASETLRFFEWTGFFCVDAAAAEEGMVGLRCSSVFEGEGGVCGQIGLDRWRRREVPTADEGANPNNYVGIEMENENQSMVNLFLR